MSRVFSMVVCGIHSPPHTERRAGPKQKTLTELETLIRRERGGQKTLFRKMNKLPGCVEHTDQFVAINPLE